MTHRQKRIIKQPRQQSRQHATLEETIKRTIEATINLMVRKYKPRQEDLNTAMAAKTLPRQDTAISS